MRVNVEVSRLSKSYTSLRRSITQGVTIPVTSSQHREPVRHVHSVYSTSFLQELTLSIIGVSITSRPFTYRNDHNRTDPPTAEQARCSLGHGRPQDSHPRAFHALPRATQETAPWTLYRTPPLATLELTDAELERQTNLLYGSECLFDGLLDQGRAAYKMRGCRSRQSSSFACGETCQAQNQRDRAFFAFRKRTPRSTSTRSVTS